MFNLVERASRYVILKKIPDCSAQSGFEAMSAALSVFPAEFRQSITLDNGSENTAHQRVESELGIETYFCHPYCASERGTVENRNGFIRRFLPKKTNFEFVSEQTLQQIQDIHNQRPMKCLGFKTLSEVFLTAAR